MEEVLKKQQFDQEWRGPMAEYAAERLKPHMNVICVCARCDHLWEIRAEGGPEILEQPPTFKCSCPECAYEGVTCTASEEKMPKSAIRY